MSVSQGLPLKWVKFADLILDERFGRRSDFKAWKKACVLGCAELLQRPALALFCSVRCPGAVILKTYDLARALRQAGVSVVSGFHTPMEKECLDLLLRGRQPIIICPARGIEGMRLPGAIKAGIHAGRILLISPFEAKQRRLTASLADERNRLVSALASELFVAYAAPGGKTEQLCREIIGSGKPVLTFDCADNANLIDLGAKPTSIEELLRHWPGAMSR